MSVLIHAPLTFGVVWTPTLEKAYTDAVAVEGGAHAATPRGVFDRMLTGPHRALKRRLAKLRRNLHGWMESAHYDSANFLLRNFDLVIEPKLDVSELVQKKTRVISSATARKMLTWSHYKFRERLTSASTRYAGRHVLQSTEPGTSKTCTNCGFWKADLGGAKTYTCNRCKVVTDRDVAGARNNFLSEYGRAVGVGWDGV